MGTYRIFHTGIKIKILSFSLFAVLLLGLFFVFPGAIPLAEGAHNANLFVSAENSQFSNYFAGPQVIEVIVADPAISDTDIPLGEPDVTVNGKDLRMSQATDGNWYAYFADRSQAQEADQTQASVGIGKGLDFGEFCDESTSGNVTGISFTDTVGVAVAHDVTNGTDGTGAFGTCTAGFPSPTFNHVVREPKTLNPGGVNGTLVGQTGINSNLWPIVQLYDFTPTGNVVVIYNQGGGPQSATLTFDSVSSTVIDHSLDRYAYLQNAEVLVTLTEPQFNVDPTDEDSWTFSTVSGSEQVYYQAFDENGLADADGTAGMVDITPSLSSLMFGTRGKITVDHSASGPTVTEFGDNNDQVYPSSTPLSEQMTFTENSAISGIFTNYDETGNSNWDTLLVAPSGETATITYDGTTRTALILNANGRIVFDSDRDGNWEIYTMNSDGTGQTNISNNGAIDSFSSWSSDATKITFQSDRDGNFEIYTMNANGTGQTNISNNAAADQHPAWFQNSSMIAFSSDRDGNFEIYRMHESGFNQTNISNNSAGDFAPSWSPNGTKIAFMTDRDGNFEIYTMNSDGTGQTRLTINNATDFQPRWSLDGTKIVFVSDRDGNQEIYTMNPDGTGETRLTNNTAEDAEASWSPDDVLITFRSDRDGNSEIYTMSSNGTGQTRITNNSAYDELPSWGTAPDMFTNIVELDSEQYEINTSGNVTVTDSAADLNPSAIDTVFVLINSTADQAGFNVTLGETAINTGIFVSQQILFSSAATNSSQNILHVSAGSTVFANYNPTDSALILCSGCGVGATPPAVRFNSELYEHETSGQLNIDDSTRNGNAAAVDTFNVMVKSVANPTGITVPMVEDAVNSGRFVSSPLITFTRDAAGDPSSYLLVNNLDTVMLTAPYTVGGTPFNPAASIVPPFQPPQQGNIVEPAPPSLSCDNDVDGNGNSDNDNDGICDLWEFQGGAHSGSHNGLEITFGGDFYQYVDETDGVTCKPLIDDPAASAAEDAAYGSLDDDPFCPDPNKKDVFVEIDYMTGHKPDASALRKVVEAFATAPSTVNPPGPTGPVYGINLHLLVDGDIGFHQINLPEDAVVSAANPHGGFKQIKQSNFMTQFERDGLAGDIPDILTAKRQIFHYVNFIHNDADNPGSGVAETGGNDVIIALGEFDNHLGSPDQQSGTLMHELGHNLNLRHGGDVLTPICKPNYISVMGYGFQMSNIVAGRPLDFSRSELPMMAESSLSEPVGFARTSPPGLQTVYGGVSNTNTALSRVVANTNDATIGLAAGTTSIYVTDPGNHRIQRLTSDLVYDNLKIPNLVTPVSGTGDGLFKSPEGIAVDSNSNIFVSDTNNHRIQKLNSDGGFVTKTVGTTASTANGRFNSPEGIAVDSTNKIFVADKGNNRIQRLTNGLVYDSLKIPASGTGGGTGNGQFKSPWGVAVDGSNLYVADTGNHRIQKFTISGNTFTFSGKVPDVVTPFAGSANGQFISPRGIAVANNIVYVADTGNNRIQKFDASTLAFLGTFGSPGTTDGLLNSPEGIAVDSTGNIYVADTSNTRIQKFDSNGVYITQIGSAGTGDGQFSIDTPIGYNFNRQVSGSSVTNTGVSQPIHVLGISECVPSAPIPGVFSTTPRENIYGYNDWANLDLFFRNDGLFSDGFSDFDTLVELTPDDNNVLLSSNIIAIDELLFSFNPDVDFPQPPEPSLNARDAIHADLLAANNLIISGDLEAAIPILDVDVRAGILGLPLVPDDPELFDAEDIRAELLVLLENAISSLNSATQDATISQIFADDDSATTNQGSPVDISVLANDGDESGAIITIDSFTQGAIGGVTNIGVDVLRYMPNAGQSGADSFTYTISNVAGQTDSATVTINIIPVAPQFVIKWGSFGTTDGKFKNPTGIDVDSAGKVYVGDSGNNRIQKFSSTGTFDRKWGSFGTSDGKFKNPNGIGVDLATNKVYVADSDNNRIQKFSSTGTFDLKWGSFGSGDGQFKKPRVAAVDSAGNVYVADSVNNRIQKFSSTGTFILKWGTTGNTDGKFNNPIGVDVDSFGNVYVVDSGNHRIQKFSSTGTFIVKWGSFGTGNGQFKNPIGIAVDSPGNVYIADTGNHRVQKFVP